jgi:uncharacterized membrane protein YdjX (TVP38/TMEM64 family)
LGGPDYLTLTALQTHKAMLLETVEQHYGLSIALAMFVYIFVVALSLPGAAFLSLVVGFIFGRWVGWFILILSATIGAVLLFWLVRYLFYDWAKAKLDNIAAARKMMTEFGHHSLNYLLFLRLVPLFPFWLVNLTMAFTHIKTAKYALGTFLGIMPGSFVFANLGQSLAEIDTIDHLFSPQLLLALFLLGVLMLLPVIISRHKHSIARK